MSAIEYSNYPNGFSPGAVIREVLDIDIIPNKVLWVGNNPVLLKGERGASDLNKGTFYQPFSTIDAAYNALGSSDGSHAVIFVRPNHTLSIADATTLVMDLANVHIIGLGVGEDRPTITFATATSAAIPVSGDNNSFANFILKCNIASQNHMFDLTGGAVRLINCDFREGSATGLNFITADGTDADIDRSIIRGCKFYAPTAGNYNSAIELGKDFTDVLIEDCDIYGDFDDAGINAPAAGNAQVNLQIRNSRIANLQSGQHAIQINGTSSTGMIVNCQLQGDTLGTIVDAGGLEMFEVYEHDGTDQRGAVLSAQPLEGAGNQALGEVFTVQKSLTSSAITTCGVDVTGTASGGDILIEEIIAETDGTGLAAGTNFTIEKDAGTGVLTFMTQAVTALDEGNESAFMSDDTKMAVLDSGQKLVAKCTGSSCTGCGVIDLTIKCRRLSNGSTVAAA